MPIRYEARVQGWPDSETVRKLAYAMYEAALNKADVVD